MAGDQSPGHWHGRKRGQAVDLRRRTTLIRARQLGRILVLAVEREQDIKAHSLSPDNDQTPEPLMLLALNGTDSADWDELREKVLFTIFSEVIVVVSYSAPGARARRSPLQTNRPASRTNNTGSLAAAV